VEIVEPAPVEKADPLPIGGVPIAKLETGEWWRLKIIGHHTLITGATEAGKSGVIWAMLQALQEAIDSRLAQLWVIDPRGGMELGMAAHMFARFAFEHEEVYADLLEDAVRVMRRRQQAALGVAKIHTPTVAEPQIALVVDEIGSLTSYTNNRPARKRIEAALALLLSQGRLSGISVIGCIQDPRKETLHLRDLFPTRICLRVTEADHVGMLFGPGAVARGARCHLIAEETPGVGYVGVDGHPDYDRVRFCHDEEWIAGLHRRRYERGDPHRQRRQQPQGRHLQLVTDEYEPIPRLTNL
jgi:S-DNA-T family DNA segregation ATPase FtsK/SpoIIIE